MGKRLHKSGRIMKGKTMSDDELKAALLKVEDNRPDSFGISTQWYRNPEGPQAWEMIEALEAENTKLRAERDGAYALAEKVARDYASKAKLRGWVTAPHSAALAAQHIAQNIRQLKGQHHD
jgi:hypothetical protein